MADHSFTDNGLCCFCGKAKTDLVHSLLDDPMKCAKAELYQRIQNDFTFHPPKLDQARRYTETRTNALVLAEKLIKICPVSRELSLALTKLDEVVYWANASIARNE